MANLELGQILISNTSPQFYDADWSTDGLNMIAEVIAESERLYRVQSQALVAAEQAIAQSRQRLDGAFARLANMQAVVNDSLNEDGTVRRKEPIKVESRRTAPAIDAPSARAPKKSVAKKTPSKRK